MIRTRRPRPTSQFKNSMNPLFVQWYPVPDDRNRLIGTNVSDEVAEHFSVMSVYYGVTRSEALRRLVEEWLAGCPTMEEALEELARRVYESWKLIWWENRHKPGWKGPRNVMKRFHQWINRAQRSLRRRSIQTATTDRVIYKVKEMMLLDSSFSPFERPEPTDGPRKPAFKDFPVVRGTSLRRLR